MNDLVKNAIDDRKRVYRKAVAHELSAENHRHRGVQIGGIATIVSAIVGSTVFFTIISQFGLDGKGTIAVPSKGLAWLAYIGFGLLSVLAPVLTGLQTFLNHPEQAQKHRDSYARYNGLKRRLDSFISKYEGAHLTDEKLAEALKEQGEISAGIEEEDAKGISLTPRAYKDADAQIASEG
jgi:hypothetical protein